MNQDHETETGPAAPGRGAEAAEGPAAPGRGAEEAAGSNSGLFGKLPRSRPGTRSPRRRGTEATAPEPAPAPEPEPPPAPPPPTATEPTWEAGEPEPAATQAEQPAGGIEELAWAGIAVTAEAATLGVRLLSRAINAARRAADRD
jgi:hypothetical protein